MKIFLLIVLAIATVWDGFTTVYGTIQVLGSGPFQIMASLLFSALILAFVLNTRRIIKWRSDFVGVIARFFWVIALGYDFYTSWIGNKNLVVPGTANTGTIILIGLTLLVVASPILLSTMGRRSETQREEETLSPGVEVTRI